MRRSVQYFERALRRDKGGYFNEYSHEWDKIEDISKEETS